MKKSSLVLLSVLLFIPVVVGAQEIPRGTTWEWVGTVHSDGTTESPSTLGHTVQIFLGDDAQYVRYENESQAYEGSWYLSVADSFLPDQPNVVELGSDGVWVWSIDNSGPAILRLQDSIVWSGGGWATTVTKYFSIRTAVATDHLNWGAVKSTYR